jgi:predicted amidohydrolase YtcJ
MANQQVFINARIFANSNAQKEATSFVQSMVIGRDKILHTGSEKDDVVQQAINQGADIIDLNERVVVPGLIDAHTHLLFFGLSRNKLDLTYSKSLDEVKNAISEYARDHPELPRILCRGWHQPSTGRQALATMLDGLDSRPIYVEALDLHSTWVSSAALDELPLDHVKGLGNHQVPCDENGRPTGLFGKLTSCGLI